MVVIVVIRIQQAMHFEIRYCIVARVPYIFFKILTRADGFHM